ncbi:MAG: RES family NAD+ phosphorylase [Bacteroidetes bacterium]|nr:RES family NAD+ phosphorylase [Bacteroidota bacterium]
MTDVYRISKCQYINDLKGTGAASYAGRWHSKGTYILYTALTASLALLESVVHISGIPLIDYCMISLKIPDENIIVMNITGLPSYWSEHPAHSSLGIIGDKFVKENKYLAMKIPSAIMPEDYNVLINPNHKDFEKVKVNYTRKVPIDNRFFKTN